MQVRGGSTDAAVLVPLYVAPGGELHAVFTERRDDLPRHPGEISFPGGRREPGEELAQTALREAFEEVGLAPAGVDLLGALMPVGTFVSGYAVYPFVGLIGAGSAWTLSEREVARVLELPLRALREGVGEHELRRRGMTFRTTAYTVAEQLIWGATARIVEDLLARLDAVPELAR